MAQNSHTQNNRELLTLEIQEKLNDIPQANDFSVRPGSADDTPIDVVIEADWIAGRHIETILDEYRIFSISNNGRAKIELSKR